MFRSIRYTISTQCQVGAETNKYQHSFIARKIRDWNSLPNSVIEKQYDVPSLGAIFNKMTLFLKLNISTIIIVFLA